ncbi:hypothetical protein, partial [Paenibacillus oryzisoli]|uniref:hypothetical protein n=1 Tax=Paenibacillus oryzisoli TaxID=1850517 RepID=UPI00195B4E79
TRCSVFKDQFLSSATVLPKQREVIYHIDFSFASFILFHPFVKIVNTFRLHGLCLFMLVLSGARNII